MPRFDHPDAHFASKWTLAHMKKTIREEGGFIVSSNTLRERDLLDRFLVLPLGVKGFSRRAARLYQEAREALAKVEAYESDGYTYEAERESTGLFYRSTYRKFRKAVSTEEYEQARDALAWIVNEELFDLMNELAPDGYYFGSSEGDGACFGFWACDDDY